MKEITLSSRLVILMVIFYQRNEYKMLDAPLFLLLFTRMNLAMLTALKRNLHFF